MASQQVIEEVLDRLLGVKVCLEEILGVSGLKAEHTEAFERALDAALEIEAALRE
jgi:hypothetical protein